MSRWRILLWPSIAATLAMALLLGLGLWQLRRLDQKLALITRIDARIHRPAADITSAKDWPQADLPEWEYRPVRLHGNFLNDKHVLVFEPAAKIAGELVERGFLVLTPLKLADGSIIVVNRGFVSDAKADVVTRPEGQIAGEITVTGPLRLPQLRNSFTPADDPAKDLWYSADPQAIAKAKGLDHAAPFFVDADSTPNPGGWPKGGTTEINIPNRHLEYAVTWFGLALTLLGVYAFFARALWRGANQNQ